MTFDLKDPKTRGKTLLAIAAVFAIGFVLTLFIGHKPRTTEWVRPQLATVPYTVQHREDLATIAYNHGNQPGLMLAAANDHQLGTHLDTRCTDRSWPRPGHYYCNPRLNLARASTLDPNQPLRIPDASALPSDVSNAAQQLGGADTIILVHGGTNKQRNLDAAVQFNLALDRQGKHIADIWVYTDRGMVQYQNEANLWPFGGASGGLEGALKTLSSRPVGHFVAITEEEGLRGFQPTFATPVSVYCMTSACQPGAELMVKLLNRGGTGSAVVPYTGNG